MARLRRRNEDVSTAARSPITVYLDSGFARLSGDAGDALMNLVGLLCISPHRIPSNEFVVLIAPNPDAGKVRLIEGEPTLQSTSLYSNSIYSTRTTNAAFVMLAGLTGGALATAAYRRHGNQE